jgi:hypothetical protein
MKFGNFPLDEIIAQANERIADGATVYQKFTCDGCGQRLTIEEPNTFHVKGACDQCDVITDIRKSGCNYMLVLGEHP